MLCNQSISLHSWTTRTISDCLSWRLHVLMNEKVPGTGTMLIIDLPVVAISYYNVWWLVSKTFFPRVGWSLFADTGSFCLLKRALTTTFVDSSNALLLLDGIWKNRFIFICLIHLLGIMWEWQMNTIMQLL